MYKRRLDAKTLYTSGLYPSYVQAYAYLKNKYESKGNSSINTRLDAIAAFIEDVENSNTISLIELVCHKTLEKIKEDLISYMTGSHLGGDDNNTSSSNPEVAKPIVSNINLKPNTIAEGKPINNTFNPIVLPYDADNVVSLSDAQKEKINESFKQYHATFLRSVESISPNNKILSNIIRPPVLGLLVKRLNAAVEFKDNNMPIHSYIWTIIQWYLLHNNAKGINLKSYDDMRKTISTIDDELKPFIDDLNKFIEHCI